MNKTIRDLFTPEEWTVLTEEILPELRDIADLPLPEHLGDKEDSSGS